MHEEIDALAREVSELGVVAEELEKLLDAVLLYDNPLQAKAVQVQSNMDPMPPQCLASKRVYQIRGELYNVFVRLERLKKGTNV